MNKLFLKDYIFGGVFALTAIAILLQFAGSLWLAEMFTSLRFYYVLPLGLCCLYYMIARKWYSTTFLLCLAGLNFLPVWGLCLHQNELPSAAEFKVVQVNVENKNHDTAKLVHWLRSVNADLIAVEELTPEWDVALRKAFPDHFAFTLPRTDYFGIGIFSKSKIDQPETFIPVDVKPAEPAIFARLSFGEADVLVGAIHTLAPHRPEEMDRRNKQLAQLADFIRSKQAPAIVLGDLNTVPWSYAFGNFLKQAGVLRDARLGHGICNTCCVKQIVWIPIDYCLVSQDFRVLDHATGPQFGSDHVPLVVKLGGTVR